MCGIAGIITRKESLDDTIIVDMIKAIKHRGPDSLNYKKYKTSFATIELGHSRLSIVDLTNKSTQPFEYEGLSVVFNGEIYNYKSLREQLINLGYSFNTLGDTEVLLKAFHKWGTDSINKLIGVFAIAILDRRINKMYLIRDRAGEKPLYWTLNNGLFLFASELKSFFKNPIFYRDKKLSNSGVMDYFRHGFISGEESIYYNVFKVMPGKIVEFDFYSSEIKHAYYWNPTHLLGVNHTYCSYQDTVETLNKLLFDVIDSQIDLSVPYGIFLSGGIDSSITASIATRISTGKVNTFCLGFQSKKFDETDNARIISTYLNTNHNEVSINGDDVKNILMEIPYIFDEPISDPSIIPMLHLSKFCGSKIKVALSSDGADELFAGYSGFSKAIDIFNLKEISPALMKNITNFLLNNANHALINFSANYSLINKVAKLQNIGQSNNLISIWKSLVNNIPNSILKDLIIEYDNSEEEELVFNLAYDSQNSPNMMLLYSYMNNLAYGLNTKLDRATMAYSIEARTPFLDHRIAEFAFSLPWSYKLSRNSSKIILKEVLSKHIPRQLWDRPKYGFTPPLNDWMRGECRDILNFYLTSKSQILCQKTMKKILDSYINGKSSPSLAWTILNFRMWEDKWLT